MSSQARESSRGGTNVVGAPVGTDALGELLVSWKVEAPQPRRQTDGAVSPTCTRAEPWG